MQRHLSDGRTAHIFFSLNRHSLIIPRTTWDALGRKQDILVSALANRYKDPALASPIKRTRAMHSNSITPIFYNYGETEYLTCCNVLWSCISMSAHDLCGYMGFIPCRTCFCQAKIWKFCVEFLHWNNNKEQDRGSLRCTCFPIRVGLVFKHTESRRMFDALKSRYITWFSASCKNDKPLAAPIATLSLIAHDKGSAPPEK